MPPGSPSWLKRKLSQAFRKDNSTGFPPNQVPTWSPVDVELQNLLPPHTERQGKAAAQHPLQRPRSDFNTARPPARALPPSQFWQPPPTDSFWTPVRPDRGPFASGALPITSRIPNPDIIHAPDVTPVSINRQAPRPCSYITEVHQHQRPPHNSPHGHRIPHVLVNIVEERDCIICAETKPSTDFPLLSASRNCSHSPQTCLSCLQRHIKTAIADKAWHPRVATCPECSCAMDYDEVRMHADRATFETFDARMLNDAITQQSNWFSCPGVGCGSGQIHDAGDRAPIVTCAVCRRKYCFRHRVAWHETMSCAEYDRFLADPVNFRSTFEAENERVEREREANERCRRELEAADFRFAQSLAEDEEARIQAEARAQKEEAARVEAERKEAERKAAEQKAQAAAKAKAAEDLKRRAKEDAASEVTVKRTTKKCPGCSWPIEKNHGCAHMTCTKCSHEFCWKCLGNWTSGHGCRWK